MRIPKKSSEKITWTHEYTLDMSEKTAEGEWRGGRNPSETRSNIIPPKSAHYSSQSLPQPWLKLTWDGERGEVLFFIAGGVSQHFPPNQSTSCSTVKPFVGVGVREGFSSSSSIIPPILNIVYQMFQAGLGLSPRILPAPCEALFRCPFLSSSKVSHLFSLFPPSNMLYH